MAQIIKHRRGGASKLNTITPQSGELIVSTGSSPLNGAVLHVGDGSTLGGIAAGRIFVGGTAPNVTGSLYGNAFNDLLWYDTGSNALYRLRSGGTGNQLLNLDGNTSGDNITLSGALANGNTTSGYSINISSNDKVIFSSGSYVQGDMNPSAHLTYSLGRPGARWNEVYTRFLRLGTNSTDLGDGFISSSATMSYTATKHNFIGNVDVVGYQVSASLFSGSFVGDGSGLTNVATTSTLANVLANGNITNGNDLVITSGDNLVISGSGKVAPDSYVYFGDNLSTNYGYVQYNTSLIPGAGFTIGNGGSGGVITFFDAGTTSITDNTVQLLAENTVVGLGVTDLVTFYAKVNSDFLPSGSTFDLGDTTNKWRNLYLAGTASLGNVIVNGDLIVHGTQSIVNSEIVTINDNIVVLNADSTAGVDGGIYVFDQAGTPYTASLLWDSTGDYWKAGDVGNEHRIVLQENAANLTNNVLPLANATGNLVNSIVSQETSGGPYLNAVVNGHVMPGTGSVVNIGSLTKLWNNVFAVNISASSTVQTATVTATNVNATSASVDHLASLLGGPIVVGSNINAWGSSITASAFYGNGAGLTGITATSASFGLSAVLVNDNRTNGHDLVISSGDNLSISGSARMANDVQLSLGNGGAPGYLLYNTALVAGQAVQIGNSTGNNGVDMFDDGNINVSSAYTASLYAPVMNIGSDVANYKVYFGATVASDFLPNISNTFVLGNNANRWQSVNAASASIGNLNNGGNDVTATANLVPVGNNVFDLGASGAKWNHVFANSGSYDYLNVTGVINGTANLANNLTGGVANQVAYQSAPNVTTFTSAPTVAGDILQYNGSNLVFSNVIDGGSF